MADIEEEQQDFESLGEENSEENDDADKDETKEEAQPKVKEEDQRWWQKRPVTYGFASLRIRARLERLMGSNLVRLTDRTYMQRLQERIKELHVEDMEKRIHERALRETDREKALLLAGYIPMSQCPPELANHPVFVINKMTQRIIAARRAKMQTPASKALKYLKDLADSMVTSEMEAKAVKKIETIEATGVADDSSDEDEDEGEEEEEGDEDPFMYTPDEFDRLRYEDPRVRQLMEVETVEELYALADEIMGDCLPRGSQPKKE